MAQGFVTSLNLRESASPDSDRLILTNLVQDGGVSGDLQLFSGNTQHRSRLINDPFAEGQLVQFGSFEQDKNYKIFDSGSDRGWTSIGASTGDVNEIFTATGEGDISTGSGGLAIEISPKREFDAVFDSLDGWTLVVRPRIARIAFTEGTLLSIDGGSNYDYIVVNSDAVSRFQLAPISDPTGPAFNFATSANGNTPGNVDTLTLTRDDTITIENLKNAHVESLGQQDQLFGGFSEINEETIVLISPDPWDTDPASGGVGQLAILDQNISGVEVKKSNVIVGYSPNIFKLDSGVRFDGGVRVVNNQNAAGKVRKIGVETNFGDLVAGEIYKVVKLGTSSWESVGSITKYESPEITGGNIIPGEVYEIINLGYRTGIGVEGVLSFSFDDVDDVNDTITFDSPHGLSDSDEVFYTRISGESIGDNGVTGDMVETIYYVKVVNSTQIKLSKNSSDVDQDQVDMAMSVSNQVGEYRLDTNPQANWNAIVGSTGVTYVARSQGIPVVRGTYFTAQTHGGSLSNAIVKHIVFKATTAGGSVDTGSTALIVDSVGLYIRNPANGEAKRAFTGTDNPWQKVEEATGSLSNNLDIPGSVETNYTLDGTLGGTNKPGVVGTSGSRTLNVPALKTTSDTAQAGDFIFDRKDVTTWGNFVVSESYIITDVGDNNTDWNDVSGTTGVSYLVGDSFRATHSGNGLSGTGGEAVGEPKLLFTNANQDSINGNGLQNLYQTSIVDGADIVTNNAQFLTNNFTHMIPITVNGESYQLLAYADEADVRDGIYKVLVM